MSNNRFHNKKKKPADNYVPPFDSAILVESIDSLAVNDITMGLMKTAGFTAINDVVKRSVKDLYAIPHFNKKNYFDVLNALKKRDLFLKPLPPKPEESQNSDADALNEVKNNASEANFSSPQKADTQRQPRQNPPNQHKSDNLNPNNLQKENFKDKKSFNSEKDTKNVGERVVNGEKNVDRFNNKKPDVINNRNLNTNINGQRNPQSNFGAKSNRQLDGINNQKQNKPLDNVNQRQMQNKGKLQQNGNSNKPKFDDKIKENFKSIENLNIRNDKLMPKKQVIVIPQDKYVKINKNGKWGFVDRSGKEMVACKYDEVFSYKDEVCCVEINEAYGFIDRGGNEIVPIEYEIANSFSEGFACVFKNGKCGYIDKENNIIVSFKYDAGTSVIDGNCRVKKDGKWGELFIDKKESEIRWIV